MLSESTTLYIGNLSYYTSEEQIYELFCRAGDVRRVVMGIDRFRKTPCGFCFVEFLLMIFAIEFQNEIYPCLIDRYYTREDAENAMRYINGTRLDDRCG